MKTQTLILIGIIFVFIGFMKMQLQETPNERVERINSMANHECSQYETEMARDCFAYWYSMIEDRD